MSSDRAAAAFCGITVSYGGVTALNGMDLEIPGLGVFGLLGRNGAGKTTAIRALVGLVKPSAGSLEVFGRDPGDAGWSRDRISVLFAEDGLVPSLTVEENLSVWAGLCGTGRREASILAGAVLADIGISQYAAVRVKELSTGNRRLAALARTFMLPADMVILDEPTSSLDPVRADEVRRAIGRLAESRLVLLSTHNLPEAEELCDTVAIIDRGRVVISGPPGELEGMPDRLLVRTESGSIVFRGETLEPSEDGCVILDCADAPADVLAELVALGNRVTEFRTYRKSLSGIFLELTGGDR